MAKIYPYGEKRDYPKIEIWAENHGPFITTWSRTVKEARERYARAIGLPVDQVKGKRVKK